MGGFRDVQQSILVTVSEHKLLNKTMEFTVCLFLYDISLTDNRLHIHSTNPIVKSNSEIHIELFYIILSLL